MFRTVANVNDPHAKFDLIDRRVSSGIARAQGNLTVGADHLDLHGYHLLRGTDSVSGITKPLVC